jgi:hypothetical protein
MNWSAKLRRRRAVALALSACVMIIAVPTAVAQDVGYRDLRSPDARDAAVAAERAARPAPTYRDLRSPDVRMAAVAAERAARPALTSRDLRSPDARDAARGTTTGSQSVPEPAPAALPTVIAVEEHGSQTLAIVFSASALLLALLAVGFVAVSQRPRSRWSAP